MYNPSIPALSYVDIPNYKTLKSNAQLIPKASDRLNVPQYEAQIGQEGLQYDQTIGRANLVKEREAAMTVADYSNRNFISNDPHQKELYVRLIKNLNFSYPNIIYEAVIADARTLPKILFLEQRVSFYYSRIVMNNIMNIYTYSPAFYSKTLTKNDINFKLYERFIYLLTLIQIVLDNKDQSDFMEKDDRMRDVVEWCLTRKIQDINYLLQGPTSNQEYSIDYQTMYYSLISPSSSKASVADYLTLATLQEVNANLLKYREEFIKNPNVYDKNPNYAQSYTISIDTRQNAHFKYDNIGNLVVDCNDIDLGSSTNDNIDLDINNTIVNTETLKYEPKSQPTKFANLLHQFSIFRIKSLLILKTTYQTVLRNYDTCYITFPSITLDGRFNQVYKNGALQVAGKFKENNNNKYWEFEPFNDVVYIPKTANVKKFEFYVSPKPGTSNKPYPNNFKIASEINKYFNIPIRVHSIEELNNTPLAPSEELLPDTYIIHSYKINNKGNPAPLKYTFLYNRTRKTIQVLPGQMDISTVPKFGVKRKMKSIQIHTGMMKPQYPATRVMIYESIVDAAYFNRTTFRLPRIIPLADLNAVEYLLGQALIKGEPSIKFKTDIRSYRFQIPEAIVNNSFININSNSTVLTEWIRMIIRNVGYDIIETDDPSDPNYEKYIQFKNEIINKINDALVNKRKEIYIVDDRAFEEFNINDLRNKFGMNTYKILEYINSKEYDYSSALQIKIFAVDKIYTTEYINNKINEAIQNEYDKIYVSTLNSNSHFEYFTLYLENGEGIDIDSLPLTDIKTVYKTMKNKRTSFDSSLGITIYINYIPTSKIKSQITSVGSNYIMDEILKNVDTNGNISKTIKFEGFNEEYKTYDLYTKEYLSDNEIEQYKNRIERLEKQFEIILSTNPKVVQKYYIEYYSDDIKNRIYHDIYNEQYGIININGINYRYVYFDDSNRNLIFDALKNGNNYYYTTDSNGIQHKTTITLYSKDILIKSARIYYYKLVNDNTILIPKDEYDKGLGYIEINDNKYYYVFYDEKIAIELNRVESTEYSDNNIKEDCMTAAKNQSNKLPNTDVQWIKLPLSEDVHITTDEGDQLSGLEAVLYCMSKDDTLDYDTLYENQTYTNPRIDHEVKIIVVGVNKMKYELSKDTNDLLNYAISLEAQLSDEYQQALRNYEVYISSDKTNIIDTTIPLPHIEETDTKDEIYRKWSNYYGFYGLFIPDFNYILDYEPITTGPAQIYEGKDVVDVEDGYSLYDWMVPQYNVTNDGIITRTTKRVDAVLIENINEDGEHLPLPIIVENGNNDFTSLLIENIKFKDNYELKNYIIEFNDVEGEYKIKIAPSMPITGAEPLPLTITQKTKISDNVQQIYYEFILTQGNVEYTRCATNILLPDNTPFNYSTYEDSGHQHLTIGVDSSIQYPTIKINNQLLSDIEGTGSEESKIENIKNYIDSLYILKVNGEYTGEPLKSTENPNGIDINDVNFRLSNENFQEYDNHSFDSRDDIITIDYDIETVEQNVDNTTTTYNTSITIEYPNNLVSINEMNGLFSNYICNRNFDISKNIYKTFIIEDNILEKDDEHKKYSFSSDNWLYSVKKLMYATSKTSPYVDTHDLKLKMLTNSTKEFDYSQYLQPVLIKYYIQWINNYDIHLIIHEHDYGFSDVSAFINNNEYKLQVITDNLFSLDYKDIINDTLEIYSSGSRFKMIIQLL